MPGNESSSVIGHDIGCLTDRGIFCFKIRQFDWRIRSQFILVENESACMRTVDVYFINKTIFTTRVSVPKHKIGKGLSRLLKWLEHLAWFRTWRLESPVGRYNFCLKNFDTNPHRLINEK